MKSKKFTIIILFVFFSLTIFGQNELTGKITDKKTGSALAGVTVYIPDLKLGAVTDEDGKYTIKNIPKGTFLAVASFIGYASQTKEITVQETAAVDFVMEESGTSLTEVVVTGVSAATEQRNNPVPINIVSQKDLLQNSATHIIDAIAVSPGVSQITLGPNI